VGCEDGLVAVVADDQGDDGARQVADESGARLGRGILLLGAGSDSLITRDGGGAFHLDIAGGGGDVLADLDVVDFRVGHCRICGGLGRGLGGLWNWRAIDDGN
jgi:hypothetical protein